MFTKSDIEAYFTGEKQESLLFLFIGIAGISTAIIFFFLLKTSFYLGAAIPLLVIGLLLGIVGYTIYKRSDDDRKRNVYAYDMNPSALKEKELPRMKKVMKNFVIYRWVEIFLFLLGTGLYICREKRKHLPERDRIICTIAVTLNLLSVIILANQNSRINKFII